MKPEQLHEPPSKMSAWPPEIEKNLNQVLLQQSPSHGPIRFLEVGTGSGRTTRALLQGRLAKETDMIGLDISFAKLRRLYAQAPSSILSLLQADANRLPFSAHSFDIILTIHVLHLLPDWKTALLEFRRLLRSGGVYLRRKERGKTSTIWDQVRQQWQTLLWDAGLSQNYRERPSQSIDEYLVELGASHASTHLGSVGWESSPGMEIDRIITRTELGTWWVPRETMPQLVEQLRNWAIAQYGSLERRYRYVEEVVLDIWRF